MQHSITPEAPRIDADNENQMKACKYKGLPVSISLCNTASLLRHRKKMLIKKNLKKACKMKGLPVSVLLCSTSSLPRH